MTQDPPPSWPPSPDPARPGVFLPDDVVAGRAAPAGEPVPGPAYGPGADVPAAGPAWYGPEAHGGVSPYGVPGYEANPYLGPPVPAPTPYGAVVPHGGPYGPPGGYVPAPYGFPYAPPPVRPTNGLAIAALVLGVVWIYWIGSILAVVFGHVALNQVKRNGEGGAGLALAGLILGWVGVAVLVFVIIVAAVVRS